MRDFVPGAAPGEVVPLARGGPLAGMPLMAPMAPGNLVEHGRTVSSGCANAVLGGPRNIRQGIEQLRLVRARSAARPALRSFLRWMHEQGPVPEADLAEAVERDPDHRLGFVAAHELGLLAFTPGPAGRQVSLR